MKTSSEKLFKFEFVKPESLYAANGSFEGEINLQWDAVDNAYRYVIESAMMNVNRWQLVDIICDTQYVISGLRKGRSYKFRIAAVFAESQGPWSNEVSKKVK